MKRLKLILAAVTLGLLACAADAASGGFQGSPNYLGIGPVTFDLRIYQQTDQVSAARTNATATSTNIVRNSHSGVSIGNFSNTNVLRLLANSFNTNLPAGAELACDNAGSFYVLDAGGAVFMDVSSVLHLQRDTRVSADSNHQIVRIDETGTHFTARETASDILVAVVSYDDTSLSTADGTHTAFYFNGLVSQNRSIKSNRAKTSYTLGGQGDGTLQDTWTVFSGKISGKTTQPLLGVADG